MNRALKECGFDNGILNSSEYRFAYLPHLHSVCTNDIRAMLLIISEETAILIEFVNLLERFA